MTPQQAGLIISPMRAAKKAEAPEPASKSQAKRLAIQGALPEGRWLEGYGFAPDAPVVPMFMDDYGSASRLDPDEPEDEGVSETSEPEKEKKDMCLPDTDLVRTVRSTVEGLCEDLTPFTGIDVSNAVKRAGKVVRHREVAPIVRELFTDGELDNFGYTRNLITVSLPGGRQAQAWLYHHQTSDPSDYDTRAQVALPPKQTAKKPDLDKAKKPAAPPPLPPSTFIPAPGNPAGSAPAPRSSRMLNTASQQRIQKLDGRLEIPRGWIRKLGWAEGDDIRAVKQGDAIVLKPVGDVGALEEEVYKFTVDRWNRIRLTNRALNKVNRNFGQGGQHVVTLQADSIKVG
jgi:bifunctional DNA-binding transcriptional regulator/antitoxin component of YhaV-PrlF toxin-antitoxin module